MSIFKKVFEELSRIYADRGYSSKLDYLRKKGANIGNGTRLNCGVAALGTEPYLVTIGENCLFAGGVKIFTHDGGIAVLNRLDYFDGVKMDKIAPVKIGDNVYIGTAAMIMPGVTIGNNVIIGAGAIVSRDIPDNCVAVGVPARPIKTLDEYCQKAKEKNLLYPTVTMSKDQKRKYFEDLMHKG